MSIPLDLRSIGRILQLLSNTRLGFDWIYGIMPYGKKFLEIRKAANCYLNRGPVKAYQPLQLDSARSCVKHLIDNPSAFVQHFRE